MEDLDPRILDTAQLPILLYLRSITFQGYSAEPAISKVMLAIMCLTLLNTLIRKKYGKIHLYSAFVFLIILNGKKYIYIHIYSIYGGKNFKRYPRVQIASLISDRFDFYEFGLLKL